MDTVRQQRLERAACWKMAIFEALSCLLFLFLPNPLAFARLETNGFSLAPNILALLNGAGAMIYFWMADSADARAFSLPIRRLLFFLASLPLMIYLIPLGLIAVTLTGSVAGLAYIAIYLVILLVITAVFQGYSRRLEVVTLIGMAAFMILTAYSFSLSTPIQFTTFHIPVGAVTALALFGGGSYVLMLSPRARRLPIQWRRVWFIASEAVIPVYATIFMMYTLFIGDNGSLFTPLALDDLYLLIALLSYSLIRDDYAPMAS